jgi:large subunit ribosomal protein L3e
MTAFLGFKSGMSHVIRDVNKPGSRAHKMESCEPVTIIETPPMIVVGIVGYIQTSRGLRTFNTIFAHHLSTEVRRRFYKNWFASKRRRAFTKYIDRLANKNKHIQNELDELKRYCSVIRVLCHTQTSKIPGLNQKKAHLVEIQVNGGSVMDKVAFAHKASEEAVAVDAVFQTNETIDVISISKGKGTRGVVSRWGVTRLPRKTHRGLRKVACVGAWHPTAVKWTVARAGQTGYHHRTELNKKIFRIGKSGEESFKASTDYDVTDKCITSIGGFPHYGIVNNDYLILKGSVPGPSRRPITLRSSLFPKTRHSSREEIRIKFIDTSSTFGHGRFQTTIEKATMLGRIKTEPHTTI